ncbi:MAG: amidase family protein [Verrucomicrobiota bacterium]
MKNTVKTHVKEDTPSVSAFYEQVNTFSAGLKRAVFSELTPTESTVAEHEVSKSTNKPLAGMTCLIKDNFDVAGFPTRASSLFLEEVRPSPHRDGPFVQKIRETGLTILGKTQMNEFAYGLDGANPHYGDCPHPFEPDFVSGGSSSGSAWAVAKQLVNVGFGTDTGGSIRVPSAFCGLFGLRLPPNPWAHEGCIPLAPSLDTVGWMTHNLVDLISVSEALLDLDLSEQETILRGLQIEFPEIPVPTSAKTKISSPTIHRDNLPDLFAPIVSQSFSIVQSLEAYEVHKGWIERYRAQYDPSVLAKILRALSWSSGEIQKAHLVQERVKRAFSELFEKFDFVFLPVTPGDVPRKRMSPRDRERLLQLTSPASLAGLSAITLPFRSKENPYCALQCLLPPDRWKRVLPSLFQAMISQEQS